MSKNFVIIERESFFMESEVVRYLMASTNKQALEPIARKLKVLAHLSDFTIKSFDNVSGTNTAQFARCTDKTDCPDNYFFSYDSDIGCDTELLQATIKATEEELDGTGCIGDIKSISILSSITTSDIDTLLAQFHDKHNMFLAGTVRNDKVISSGEH